MALNMLGVRKAREDAGQEKTESGTRTGETGNKKAAYLKPLYLYML
jgi:hypothetical protein